jgi:transcriptional accessory protein Tex/SPT6
MNLGQNLNIIVDMKKLSEILDKLERTPDLIKLSDFAYLTVFEKRRIRAIAKQRGIEKLPKVLYQEDKLRQRHLDDDDYYNPITKIRLDSSGKVLEIKRNNKRKD